MNKLTTILTALVLLVSYHATAQQGLENDKRTPRFDGAPPGHKEARLVARGDYDIAKEWRPSKVMGRDFWHVLGVSMDTHPDKGSWAGTLMRELVDKPLFRESAINFTCVQDFAAEGSNRVSMSALRPARHRELLETRPNAPFFIMPFSVRPVYRILKPFEWDLQGYQTWKEVHPNFKGCVFGEVCNDFLSRLPWVGGEPWESTKRFLDPALAESIEKAYPKPETREEMTAQFLRVCKALRDYFFGDAARCAYMREAHNYDHYFYETGADMVWLETTNTASPNGVRNYRHQSSLFFTRGAARQSNKDWAWYIAVCYNGYDDAGQFGGNNEPNYRTSKVTQNSWKGFEGPGCGMSESMVTRDSFLAYLGGATYVQHEGWWGYLHTNERKAWDLSSPLGRAWEDWFEFTRANPDRGTSYAPVALLVPFTQGYPDHGGRSWDMFDYERPDWMIDAFMFTIMPHSPVTKAGDEGCLANSPYGDIYDVVVPDTPKGPVPLDVLSNYKVAVLMGRYAEDEALAKRLMAYVKGGGTLLMNVKQISAHLPTSFTGIERRTGAPAVPVKAPVSSLTDGKAFDLPDTYDAEAVELRGALPLLKDAAGTVLACRHRVDKGSVIVATVDCFVPRSMDYGGGDPLVNLIYGKRFPFIEHFLTTFVDEVLPIAVRGDIEYGLNKQDNGWLVYLINNKGVTKFTNKRQVLDPSKTAKVEVLLRDLKAESITELRTRTGIRKNAATNSFTVAIPPGDVRVIRVSD